MGIIDFLIEAKTIIIILAIILIFILIKRGKYRKLAKALASEVSRTHPNYLRDIYYIDLTTNSIKAVFKNNETQTVNFYDIHFALKPHGTIATQLRKIAPFIANAFGMSSHSLFQAWRNFEDPTGYYSKNEYEVSMQSSGKMIISPAYHAGSAGEYRWILCEQKYKKELYSKLNEAKPQKTVRI